ncbi:MerR family transcriptional regulator [Streptomyces jietaisiensis]|uniref:MerR family transcriptional regulator n=1 Tax=Streptomyces griseoaurantiacus TaxID=68213 RepID=A0ABZ1V8T5_9ACTN|nr:MULTISPECIES: MerR family transcriptional regulator [Streptomyces]MDX3091941.1 MerR family transcriptional regulator [Streptomyces sp. ME12-02E]MDX3334969.1 MerR family transcriptional regulator [Streptomyces sp. ME02-6978a]MDX3360079.1 MerR family transcriptional regulator [Streptomyces sp. ME02-6978.2a]
MTVTQTTRVTRPGGPATDSRAAAPPPHRRPDGQDQYTISEVAAVTGLSAHTLRWYERIGLMPHVDRSHTGQRRYSNKDLEWLGFVGKLRLTGMPVADMVRYAELVREGAHTYGERYALLESRRRDVLARVEELRDALAVLDHKLAFYGERNGSGQGLPLPAATPCASPTAPPAVAPSSPRTPRP